MIQLREFMEWEYYPLSARQSHRTLLKGLGSREALKWLMPIVQHPLVLVLQESSQTRYRHSMSNKLHKDYLHQWLVLHQDLQFLRVN